ncbi:MAG: serine/threonine-protein kinase, partial [Myxococcota bacterium]
MRATGTPQTRLEAGAVIAEQYRLDEPLTRGGMGEVWVGRHLRLDIPVAVKLMRPALLAQPAAGARFEREAKAAAQLRSPYVVQIYDHGVDRGWPFIVMELLEGQDLRAHLEQKKIVPVEEVVRICDEVCKALDRAHRAGVVHRDLKPANIFLSEPDDGMVKVLDFGIAKEMGSQRVVEEELTATGQLLGSPHYMSPEQARGLDLDGRSDLWSLAVILFRMLTGRRPFTGKEIGDLLVRICVDPVPVASEANPDLPPPVDAFFARAFQREPGERFPTAVVFATEFRQATGASPRRESGIWAPDSHDRDISIETGAGNSERLARALQPASHPGDDTLANVERDRQRQKARFGLVSLGLFAALGGLFLFSRGPSEPSTSGASEGPATSAPSESPPSPVPSSADATVAVASGAASARPSSA